MNKLDKVTFRNKEMPLSSFVDELQRLAQSGQAYFDDKIIKWAYIFYPTYRTNGYDDLAVLIIKINGAPSVKAHSLAWVQSIIKNYIKVKDE